MVLRAEGDLKIKPGVFGTDGVRRGRCESFVRWWMQRGVVKRRSA